MLNYITRGVNVSKIGYKIGLTLKVLKACDKHGEKYLLTCNNDIHNISSNSLSRKNSV